jgi:DNA repair photolyase
MIIKEIQCKTAIGKCGFPGGGLAINPYVGCSHNCAYCYARFLKRFTKHTEEWGSFVDIRMNVAEILAKQMKSPKHRGEHIHIGTVTDPYQQVENKYELTRKVLEVLVNYENPVSVLTKSDLVLRDIDLLKKFKEVDVNFTINTLDEGWREAVEPGSPSVQRRFEAATKLSREGIAVFTMMGPYWPIFTDPEKLFAEFKKAGVKHVFSESMNTVGGNWVGVEKALSERYPKLLPEMRKIFFDKKKFFDFYNEAREKIEDASMKYNIPTTVYFGQGHAAKFK